MGTGYTRNDTVNNIADGNVINASDLDGEFDAVQAAFNESTGHTHDGTSAEGAPVTTVGPAQDVNVGTSAVTPKTDNTVDLGSNSLEFKDLYIDGTANIDSLVADTADINAGTIDGTVIGGSTPAAATVTTLTVNGNTTLGDAATDTVTFTADVASNIIPSADDTYDLGASGSEWKDLYIDGTANIDSLVADTADINAGTIDGVTIGGASPGVGTFTTANATTVDATNIEVTNIKAKDGSASATIADSTGVMTIASSVLTTTDINGGSIDGVTLGTNSPVTEADIDNININGNTISSTNTDGNIDLTPNGTGEVNISKVDIDSGTIDGTAIGGASAAAGSFTTLNTSGAVVFNDAGADVDFRVEGDTEANLLFVDASADAVGIGTSSLAARLTSVGTPTVNAFSASIPNDPNASPVAVITAGANTNGGIFGGGGTGLRIIDKTSNSGSGQIGTGLYVAAPFDGTNASGGTYALTKYGIYVDDIYNFYGINSPTGNTNWGIYVKGGASNYISGNLLVGKTADVLGNAGTFIDNRGSFTFTRSGANVGYINRLASDGALLSFNQDTIEEGTISITGNTTNYNPFLGSHSGALADWSKPDIKIGTVMDTIDELLEYKVVVIDVQEEVPAKEAVLDEEGKETEPAQEATTHTVQKRISYNGNGAVGSSATVEYEGQEYTGTIHNEREEPLSFNKHLKVKVNDTAASKAVFGVFVGWNNDSNNDGGVYNDMLVGAVGNYVIRMAAGQEPQIGDLVEADGNGCAVVQDDDIIRTKTVAKVTSTIKQVTYDDGSFLVTCVLYCG